MFCKQVGDWWLFHVSYGLNASLGQRLQPWHDIKYIGLLGALIIFYSVLITDLWGWFCENMIYTRCSYYSSECDLAIIIRLIQWAWMSNNSFPLLYMSRWSICPNSTIRLRRLTAYAERASPFGSKKTLTITKTVASMAPCGTLKPRAAWVQWNLDNPYTKLTNTYDAPWPLERITGPSRTDGKLNRNAVSRTECYFTKRSHCAHRHPPINYWNQQPLLPTRSKGKMLSTGSELSPI